MKKGPQGSYFLILAEKRGFEPRLGLHPLSVFETDPFSRLGTSPAGHMIASPGGNLKEDKAMKTAI